MIRERTSLHEDPIIEELRVVEEVGFESLIRIGGHSYLLGLTPSYSNEVINPTKEQILGFLAGRVPSQNDFSPYVLLLPMQANGRCIANCKGCCFARDETSKKMSDFDRNLRLALPVTPEVMRSLLQTGISIGEATGFIGQQKIRVNTLLSGDPAFNPHIKEVIQVVASEPRVCASRWSTVAVSTGVNVLGEFIESTRIVATDHKLRFQVSLHSSDDKKRENHINYHGVGKRLRLIPNSEISEAFEKIKKETGNSSTLAFVVDESSTIDPAVLARNYSPNSTWISLRPMAQTEFYTPTPMSADKFISMYTNLRAGGWNVTFIPSSYSTIEQHNLNTERDHGL